MPSPIVIQDSDDEDIDLSSPIKPQAAAPPIPHPCHEDELITTPAQKQRDSGTTDPSFFTRVWNEQQDSEFVPSTTEDSAKGKAVLSGTKSFSSIPDPVLARVLAQQQRLQRNLENLSPLTEISTPATPSSCDALIIAMESRNGRVRKTPNMTESKVYGKKRRSSQSSPTWPPEAAMPSPVPAKKRRKTAQAPSPKAASSAPDGDEVDVVVVPISEEITQRSTVSARKNRKQADVESSIIKETQPVLEVSLEPTTMSASQKKQYQLFTSSTDNADGSSGQLPTINLTAPADNQASSGAGTASTVPFTTPSEFASPAQLDTLIASQALPTMLPAPTGTRRAPREQMPPSSPDIITQIPATKRTKRTLQSSPRNDSWNSEDIGFERDRYKPRLSKRRAEALTARDDELPDGDPMGMVKPSSDLPDTDPLGYKTPTNLSAPVAFQDAAATELDNRSNAKDGNEAEPILIGSSSPQQPVASGIEDGPPKQPKKRGRKKKDPPVTAPSPGFLTIQEGAVGSDLGTSITSETQPGRKKRGRPKKSETKEYVATIDPRQEGDTAPEDEDEFRQPVAAGLDTATSVSTTSKKERGKVNVVAAEEVTEPDPDFRMTDPGALEEKSSNVRGTGSSGSSAVAQGKPQADDHTASPQDGKENETMEIAKKEEPLHEKAKLSVKVGVGVNSSQAGKVPLRVGLSKRSRIAPLLKTFRK